MYFSKVYPFKTFSSTSSTEKVARLCFTTWPPSSGAGKIGERKDWSTEGKNPTKINETFSNEEAGWKQSPSCNEVTLKVTCSIQSLQDGLQGILHIWAPLVETNDSIQKKRKIKYHYKWIKSQNAHGKVGIVLSLVSSTIWPVHV